MKNFFYKLEEWWWYIKDRREERKRREKKKFSFSAQVNPPLLLHAVNTFQTTQRKVLADVELSEGESNKKRFLQAGKNKNVEIRQESIQLSVVEFPFWWTPFTLLFFFHFVYIRFFCARGWQSCSRRQRITAFKGIRAFLLSHKFC